MSSHFYWTLHLECQNQSASKRFSVKLHKCRKANRFFLPKGRNFRGECVPLWKMEGYVCFDFYIFDGVCNRTLHPYLVSYESGEEVAERFMILLKTVKI